MLKNKAILCVMMLFVLFLGADTVFAEWLSPSGFNDPQSQWTQESNAYDGITSTYASNVFNGIGWGQFVYLSLGSSLYCDRVRINADCVPTITDVVDIDVYRDGEWVNVWEGAIKNAAWDEVSFEGGDVTEARFRFHYISPDYTCWLYEFSFWKASAVINVPVVQTTPGSSVEETTATLHGFVVNDGGEPCEFRFQYGLTEDYGTDLAWENSMITGNTFGKVIKQLATGQTYHFRAQIKNSAGISSGSDFTFFTGAPPSGWVSPTGAYDPDVKWEEDTKVFDDEASLYARSYHAMNDPNGQWSSFLYLKHNEISSNKVRFNARGETTDQFHVSTIDVDVLRNGAWTDVYEGPFNDKQWVEKSFDEGAVTDARCRFRVNSNGVGLFYEFYEFDFYRVSLNPPVLSWTGEPNYENDGLNPETGLASTNFTYRVEYTDADDDSPSQLKLFVDKNGDGDYVDANEEINLSVATDCALEKRDGHFDNGEIYTFTTTIPYGPGADNCSYYFSASDGTYDAEGNPTQPVTSPVIYSAEMAVQGNSVTIVDGDLAAEEGDHTDFGSMDISAVPIVRTFTIVNSGTAELHLTGTPAVVLSGADAADFSVTTQPAATVAIDGSTTFEVTFSPSAIGVKNATIIISNDDMAKNPYNFAIQGTGTETVEVVVQGNGATIASGDLTPEAGDHTDFGSANIDAGSVVRIFTIVNNGLTDLHLTGTPAVVLSDADAADFTVIVQPSLTIPSGGGTTTFEVMFNPSTFGVKSAMISISNDNAEQNPYRFAIRGTGIETKDVEVKGNGTIIANGDLTPEAGDHTDFGSTNIDAGSVVRTFTIVNNGLTDLHLTGTPEVAVSGADSTDFTVTAEPAATVLADGGTTTFQVTFSPSTTGVKTAAISISNDNVEENPYIFAIKGAGITGEATVEIAIQGNGTTIANGDMTPDGSDFTNFGATDIARGAIIRSFTIVNTGSADLHLTGSPAVVVSGLNAYDFMVTAEPAATVPADGGTTTFAVTFNPSSVGVKIATILVYNDDTTNNPYYFAVQGTGFAMPEMAVKGESITIEDGEETTSVSNNTNFMVADIDTGTVVRTFTIVNTGSAELQLTGTPIVVVSGEDSTDFMVTAEPAVMVPAGGGTTTFKVTFDPSTIGVKNAMISIDNNDLNENPYNFAIKGTGVGTEPVISIETPNGGEIWTPGQEYQIAWSAMNVETGNLEFSMDYGESWSVIQSDVDLTTGSYGWTVPDGYSADCLVRITVVDIPDLSDMSDARFTINGTSPVTVQDITVELLESDNAMSVASVEPAQYGIYLDLACSGQVENVRILLSVMQNDAPVYVEEWYDILDSDNQTGIDNLTATLLHAPAGKITLSEFDPLTVSILAVTIGSVSYTDSSVAFEKVITIDPIIAVEEIPSELRISGFYPNPFNQVTTIRYSVPDDCVVQLMIYDVVGKRVAVLEDTFLSAGEYTTFWDARDDRGNILSSGLYFYSFVAGSFKEHGKLMLLR